MPAGEAPPPSEGCGAGEASPSGSEKRSPPAGLLPAALGDARPEGLEPPRVAGGSRGAGYRGCAGLGGQSGGSLSGCREKAEDTDQIYNALVLATWGAGAVA